MIKDRFGFEWEKYNSIKPHYRKQYEKQFLNWVYPLKPEFFKNKEILDAGCGMGRNSYWCLKWGARKLVACDYDERSVTAAQATLSKFFRVKVVEADLENLPWHNEFDFVFSIGVIHHTKNPSQVINQLRKTLKPGGEILLWVYAYEGFEYFVKILNPIRKYITSKINLKVLHFLTYSISIPFFIYIHTLKFKKPYFQQLKIFSLSHLHSIVFDQLLPEIAIYYTYAEARMLLKGFKNVQIYHPPNQNGWIVRGIKQM